MTVIVTVAAPVAKQCPYRQEPDKGTAFLTFRVDSGDAPELHALAKALASLRVLALSHEDFTRLLHETWRPCGCVRVQTSWVTAGLEVTVDVPGD